MVNENKNKTAERVMKGDQPLVGGRALLVFRHTANKIAKIRYARAEW